ncbi:16S rRNA (cytosine(967)-C(5))-methyltransferase RsmB [Bacillaceae bacterium Marseille-Q3522]|nr:16S rRNA (cytosine(967)-C(5))-methyltransferase RsmB [Bacillaceae bacterium Marseille-Q3522]
MKNVRETAVELLEMMESKQSYSNLLLNNAIKNNKVLPKDISLLTELVYGSLQRKITLDYMIRQFLKGNKKLELWVLQLLRISVYQMFFLAKIPDRAVLFEAVEIAKKRGHKGIASLVNGVLRNLQRRGMLSFASIKDPLERLSIETSHPLWLIHRWTAQLGFAKTKQICEHNLTVPARTARVNLNKITREECIRELENENFQVQASDIIPEAIKSRNGNLALSSAYKNGLLSIQDESSMIVAYALQPENGDKVLDACAAPGGKSTHIGEKLNNSGEIISLDIHEHKVKLIKEQASRLGLVNIHACALDSRRAQDHFPKESFDRILVDAPCSGLGVIRRKPEIKYTKTEADIQKLSEVQQKILQSVAPLLKKGGILVYSTCTIDKEENQTVIQTFLQQHPGFEANPAFTEKLPEKLKHAATNYELQLFPGDFDTDGFYIASLRKRV